MVVGVPEGEACVLSVSSQQARSASPRIAASNAPLKQAELWLTEKGEFAVLALIPQMKEVAGKRRDFGGFWGFWVFWGFKQRWLKFVKMRTGASPSMRSGTPKPGLRKFLMMDRMMDNNSITQKIP